MITARRLDPGKTLGGYDYLREDAMGAAPVGALAVGFDWVIDTAWDKLSRCDRDVTYQAGNQNFTRVLFGGCVTFTSPISGQTCEESSS